MLSTVSPHFQRENHINFLPICILFLIPQQNKQCCILSDLTKSQEYKNFTAKVNALEAENPPVFEPFIREKRMIVISLFNQRSFQGSRINCMIKMW